MDAPKEVQELVKEGNLMLQALAPYENEIIDLDDLESFNQRINQFYDDIPFLHRVNHSDLFRNLLNIVIGLNNLFELKAHFEIAKKAMREYHAMNKKDERNVIDWLLKYENDFMIFDSENKNVYGYWFKLSSIKEHIIVDCTKYAVSYDFTEQYWMHWGEIFAKYRPADKDLDKIDYHEIPNYLAFHNKHIDLLIKYDKLPLSKNL